MNMQRMKTYSVPTTGVFRLGSKDRLMQNPAPSGGAADPSGAPMRFPEDN